MKAIVVGGVFDGIHAGHLAVLDAAKNLWEDSMGDDFIVLLNSDVSLIKLGRRAQHDEAQRKQLIAAVAPDANVEMFDDANPKFALQELVKRLDGPVLFVKGADTITDRLPAEAGIPGVALMYLPVVDGGRSLMKLKTRPA
jgi:bifunctional ADP-heptose synthase (sugar kinase/adenylyltransferase)